MAHQRPAKQQCSDAWPGFFKGAALIFALVFVVYLPSVHGGFLWDDDILLTNNPLVKSATGLKDIWFSAQQPDYFPLTSTAFWLQWRLWGMEPTGYHIINLLLHASGAVVVWRILARLKVRGAWTAAAIFAVHPVCVSSVAWIAELKNTLSFVFFALSFLWFIEADETLRSSNEKPELQRCRKYWFSLGAFLLALLSKTSVVTLPFALLAFIWWRHGRVAKQDVLRIAPYFAFSVVMGLITIWFQSARIGDSEAIDAGSFATRSAAAGQAIWFYIWKALLPLNLSAIYPQWQIDATSPLAYGGWVVLVVALAIFWKFRRTWGRHALFAAAYFVAMLLPVLGFLKMSFLMHSRVADHWQYLSLLGIIAALTAGVSELVARVAPKFGPRMAGAVILALFSLLTWQHAKTYSDLETLWRDTLKKNPSSWAAHLGLGKILAERGETAAAIERYTESIRLQSKAPETHYNFGNALFAESRFAEAIDKYQAALNLRSRYPEAHYNLGMAFEREGDDTKALEHYSRAAAINPYHANANNNAGNILARIGRFDEAIASYSRALAINPHLPEAHNNLGNIFNNEGKLNEAIEHYRDALTSRPEYADAQYNLAVALEKKGNPGEALSHLREAIRLKPEYVDAHFTLANVLFNQQKFTEAETHYITTVRLRPTLFQAHYNLALTLLAQNRANDAVAHLREAVRLNPDFKEAKEELAKLAVD